MLPRLVSPSDFQLLANDTGNLRDDFGRDLVEIRHSNGNIGAQFGRQRIQEIGRLLRSEMRKDQRDCLRMLVVDEIGQLLRIRFLQRVEARRVASQRFADPIQKRAWHDPRRRR